MDIIGEYTFPAPQETLWSVLRDPNVLSHMIPMVMNVKQVADDRYTGFLFFRVGHIAGMFLGKIDLLNIQAPNSYDIQVHGSSAIGEVNMHGGMRLESQDGGTTMCYHGMLNYGGRVASVGSRLLEMSTRTIIQQSFDTLSRYLSVRYKPA